MTYRGIVKGQTVLLEEDARFPEGAEVDVTLTSDPSPDEKAAIRRLLRDKIPGRIGMDEIIEEMKRERDERDWERAAPI